VHVEAQKLPVNAGVLPSGVVYEFRFMHLLEKQIIP